MGRYASPVALPLPLALLEPMHLQENRLGVLLNLPMPRVVLSGGNLPALCSCSTSLRPFVLPTFWWLDLLKPRAGGPLSSFS